MEMGKNVPFKIKKSEKKDDFKKMKLIYSKEIIFHRLFDELQLLAIF